MKKKLEKLYTYEELGFPIQLVNVPMIEIRGEFILDIDFNKLQKAVLLHLSHKKMPLTGNEVQFIRKYFSLNITAFGRLFGYSHSAVLKWENQGDAFARIAATAEIYLRLHILDFLEKDPFDFKEVYHEIQIPELANKSVKAERQLTKSWSDCDVCLVGCFLVCARIVYLNNFIFLSAVQQAT